MPYYKYPRDTELKFESNLSPLEEMEKNKFEALLDKEENSFYDLLLTLAPPQFIQRNRRVDVGSNFFYPTLPQEFRNELIKDVKDGIQDRKLICLNSGCHIQHIMLSFDQLFNPVIIDCFGEVSPGREIIESHIHSLHTSNQCRSNSIYSLIFNTKQFIKFMMEKKFFPKELLYYHCFETIYRDFNKEKLTELKRKMLDDEVWDFNEAVMLLARFYLPSNDVEHYLKNNAELKPIVQPWRHKVMSVEPCPFGNWERTKGNIDCGEFPDFYKEFLNILVKIYKQANQARLLKRFESADYEDEKLIIDPKTFLNWALSAGYEISDEVTQQYGIKQRFRVSNKEDIKKLVTKMEKDILIRAQQKEITVVLATFPCSKKDCFAFMRKYDRSFVKADSTLGDYLDEHSNIRFVSGRKKQTSLLSKLFPELYK